MGVGRGGKGKGGGGVVGVVGVARGCIALLSPGVASVRPHVDTAAIGGLPSKDAAA